MRDELPHLHSVESTKLSNSLNTRVRRACNGPARSSANRGASINRSAFTAPSRPFRADATTKSISATATETEKTKSTHGEKKFNSTFPTHFLFRSIRRDSQR
jgi:hypothetical protein